MHLSFKQLVYYRTKAMRFLIVFYSTLLIALSIDMMLKFYLLSLNELSFRYIKCVLLMLQIAYLL